MTLPLGATRLPAQDPRVGSWRLTSAQSSLQPPDELTIVSTEKQVHVTMTGETHLDFTAPSDGKDTPVPGNLGFDQVEMRRAGRKQVEVQEKNNGAVAAVIRLQLSPDGRTLTITTARVGHADEVAVWTRSGGAKVAHDPFSGEWTEDLSLTRMQQGVVVKIEAAGNGEVRFSGGYSYTARLDGKQYDLKNSRNDTVSLALAGPHTVDSTYRRDGQVTQKDEWVVAADGRQMTMTTMGTYEDGQRVSEKLVFQKQ